MLRECACCSNPDMDLAWDLPQLPLTGIYFDEVVEPKFEYLHDQKLSFCGKCTHMQLDNIIDPNLLYLQTYTHRTSLSNISRTGNDFLLNIILSKKFKNKKQILEIGCNDIYLLSNLAEVSNSRAGIDPIFESETIEIKQDIYVRGGFAETVNYNKLIDKPVDLVISAHTFEHVVDPVKSLQNLKPFLAENVDVILEVPSSPRMINQLRLDQIFSQHINYYSPESLQKLMKPLNLELIEISHNYSYWGGTQILHFSNYLVPDKPNYNLKLSLEKVRESIDLFANDFRNVKYRINNAPGRIFAYGAAQMLPIIEYHLGDAFDLVESIFDDNDERIGRYYPMDKRKIKKLTEFEFKDSDTVIITALDSAKQLVTNLLKIGVTLIIIPIGNI